MRYLKNVSRLFRNLSIALQGAEVSVSWRRSGLCRRGTLSLLLCLAVVVSLCGCGSVAGRNEGAADTFLTDIPEKDSGGNFMIGSHVCVPSEIEGFSVGEYNASLTASGYFYAAWTTGESSSYTNSDGKEADLYDAQIYVIAYEGTDEEDAASKTAGWLTAAKQTYTIRDEKEMTITYTIDDDSNPYCEGASAFLLSDSTAVCVEVLRTPDWEGSPEAVLDSFLAGLSIQ